MKDTKRRMMTFTFYDRTGIERDLEEQAAKGWLLEKCSATGWIYRRIEPAKIHFAVVYFPAATAFDPHPSEKQQRFQEFCEHTGWELIASNVQMQIFCNRRENPIPIETDPVIELQNIHASVKKMVIPSYGMNLIVALMQIGLACQRFSWDPIGELVSLPAILSLLFWVMMVIFCSAIILRYYSWYRRAKLAAQDGHFLETKSTDRLQITMLITIGLAMVFMFLSFGDGRMLLAGGAIIAGILILSGIMYWISNGMKKRNFSAEKNRGITYLLVAILSVAVCGGAIWLIVGIRTDNEDRTEEAKTYEFNGWTYYVYSDPIPLRIEDLIETEYDGYSYEIISDDSSPLLHRYEARQKTRYDALAEPEMHYHIVQVKFPFLYDWVLDLMMEDFDHNYAFPEDDPNWEEHRSIDPVPWGAEKTFQLFLGGEPKERYLLCYKDCIIEIDLDWFPTEEQMWIISEKLMP